MNEETALSELSSFRAHTTKSPEELLEAYGKTRHPKVRFELARALLHSAISRPPQESLALLANMATDVQEIAPSATSKRLSAPYLRTLSTKANLLAQQNADTAALFLDETLNGRLHFTKDSIKKGWALSVLNACVHVSPESPIQSYLPKLLNKWGHALLDVSGKYSKRVQRFTL